MALNIMLGVCMDCQNSWPLGLARKTSFSGVGSAGPPQRLCGRLRIAGWPWKTTNAPNTRG